MKRFVVGILMIIGCVGAMAQTELYKKYSSNTNIKVACVNNLELDSVSRVEVTIFKAMDNEGWQWILNEFNVVGQSEGEMAVMFSMRDRHDPAKKAPIKDNVVDLYNSCYLCVDYNEQTLYTFISEAGSRNDAIVKYLLNKMTRFTLGK